MAREICKAKYLRISEDLRDKTKLFLGILPLLVEAFHRKQLKPQALALEKAPVNRGKRKLH